MGLKITYKDFDTAAKAAKMFELRNSISSSILSGNFKQARTAQKEFAKAAVEDFDVFKTLPTIKITNVPLIAWAIAGFRNLEYKVYKLFSKTIPEEKQLSKQYKAYIRTLDKKI